MIISTKLHIPEARTALIHRQRLMDKLNEGLTAKVTLLSAQAGYGKSTVLSQWASQCGCPAAWLSLDKRDNNWTLFWTYFLSSVRQIIPDFGQSVEPLLAKGPTASAQSAEPAIGLMLNELSALQGKLVIVLDDYHFIELSAIHLSLRYLMDYLPSNIHLYIASRSALPFPTSRLISQGALQQLLTDDLRFAPDESFDFFRSRKSLSIAKTHAEELLHYTEGWIGGMQLAAITLARSEDLEASIRQFRGRQQPIAEYLLEEVLHDLPASLRDFLLDTSVLTRLNVSLCEAVTGQSDSDGKLAQLEQLNLFLIPLDSEHKWFRYHHLLSDFLKHLLLSESPDRWTQAHARAASWHEANGFIHEAGEHYMEGRRYEEAVRLIDNHLPALLQRNISILANWVLHLPGAAMSGNHAVEMFYYFLLIGTGQWKLAGEKVDKARVHYERISGEMAEEVRNRVLGDIYFLSASVAFLRKDLAAITRYFELTSAHGGSLFSLIEHNNHYGFDEFDDHLSYINDFAGAEAFLLTWIERWGGRHSYPFVASLHNTYSKLLYEWNRLEQAEACILNMLQTENQPNTGRNLVHLYISASRIRQAAGKHASACSLLDTAKRVIESPDYDRYVRILDAEGASLALRQGRRNDALAWLDRHPQLRSGDAVSIRELPEYLAAASVMAACGRTEGALGLTDALNALLLREDRLRDRVKVLLTRTAAFELGGSRQQALDVLGEALELAMPQRFIRSFVDEGSVISSLLQCYADRDPSIPSNRLTAPLESYVSELLVAARYKPAQDIKPLKEMNKAAIRRASVRCFGRFKLLAPNGIEVKWRTAKAEELLAFLTHHRGQAVDRFLVMEALWGSDTDKTSAYFNTTAYYLRKCMTAAGITDFLEHNRGYYRIRMESFDSELLAFEQTLAASDPVHADNIAACELAVDMYANGYLTDNDYVWAAHRRSQLENQYIELVLRISTYYMQESRHAEAVKLLRKAIKQAPWSESIHKSLIGAYLARRDRLAALKQYDALKRMLRREYNEVPGDEIKRLLHLSY